MMYDIRTASEADREFCFRLNELCFRPKIEAFRAWNEATELADFADQFRAGLDSIVLVDGRRVGHWALEEHADRVELRMLLLSPDVQGHGIGSSLVRATIERARSRGVRVALWVTDWNEGAIRLYRRLGFDVVGEAWQPEKMVRKLRMMTR